MRRIGRAIWVIAGFILLGSIVFMGLHVNRVVLEQRPQGVTTLQQAEVKATEDEIEHDHRSEAKEEAAHPSSHGL